MKCEKDYKKKHCWERAGIQFDINNEVLFQFFICTQCKKFIACPHKSAMNKVKLDGSVWKLCSKEHKQLYATILISGKEVTKTNWLMKMEKIIDCSALDLESIWLSKVYYSEDIKLILNKIIDKNVRVQYLGAPKYKLDVTSSDYKKAENILKEAVDVAALSAKKLGCEINFAKND